MKKYPTGTAVDWNDPETNTVRHAAVVRHGYDRSGIYTEIKTDDGDTFRVHRSSISVHKGG